MHSTEHSAFWTKEIFHEALRNVCIKPQKVLCLGLGSPSSSRDARAQLALLSDLCASSDMVRGIHQPFVVGLSFVRQDAGDVSVYDPVFTDADRQLFQTLGMRCLDHVQASELVPGPLFKS